MSIVSSDTALGWHRAGSLHAQQSTLPPVPLLLLQLCSRVVGTWLSWVATSSWQDNSLSFLQAQSWRDVPGPPPSSVNFSVPLQLVGVRCGAKPSSLCECERKKRAQVELQYIYWHLVPEGALETDYFLVLIARAVKPPSKPKSACCSQKQAKENGGF